MAMPSPRSPVRLICPWARWPKITAGMAARPSVNSSASPQTSAATASPLVGGTVLTGG
jgi:hypothetical protein